MKSISLSDTVVEAPSVQSHRTVDVLPGVAVFGLLFVVALANGGYNPPDWNWATIAAGWVIALALLLRERIQLARAEQVMLVGVALLTAWVLITGLWSPSLSASTLGGERLVLYTTSVAAVMLILRRAPSMTVAAGALAAATGTMAVGMSDLVVPSLNATAGVATTGRLSDPVGYWNGMGLIGAMGMVLGIGMASRCLSRGGRALAGATLPVLVTGTYLTFSRGAWIALIVGLLVALTSDPERLRMLLTALVCLPWLLVDAWLTARSSALTHIGSPVGQTGSEGHRLTAVLIVSMVLIALCIELSRRIDTSWQPSPATARGLKIGSLIAWVCLLVAPVVIFGSYSATVHRVANELSRSAPSGFRAGASLNDRLLQPSGEGRVEMWREAVHQWQAHPVVGAGPGQFAVYWARHRSTSMQTLEAHSLYLQTLAELGVIGLGLLGLVLVPPLIAGWRSRDRGTTPILLGAYAAFLVHNATDWDWSLPAVALFGLVLATGLVAERRARPGTISLGQASRIVGGLAVCVVLLGSVYAVRANTAIGHSTSESASGQWKQATGDAQTATRWASWLEPGWVALGQAQLGAGHHAAAAAAFRRAIRQVPEDWQAWFGLGEATKGAVATQSLRQALALNPREPTMLAFAKRKANQARRARLQKQRAQQKRRKQAGQTSGV